MNAPTAICLDKQRIASCMETPIPLFVYDETSSTNDIALQMAREGQREPLAVLAEFQTCGRGRLGRQWQASKGHNLVLSLLWPFRAGVSLNGLSLVIGTLLVEELTRLGLQGAGMKWPNDIYVDSQKLCGILVELEGDLQHNPVAIIGIGVNGWLGEAASRSVDQPVTDWWSQTGNGLDRNTLAAHLLSALARALPLFSREGIAAFRKRWMQYDLCVGHELWLLQGGSRQAVTATGLADDGGLLVAADGREWCVYGGEVSIRWQ